MKELDLIFNELNLSKEHKGCHDGHHWFGNGETFISNTPVNNQRLGEVTGGSLNDFSEMLKVSQEAFVKWRSIPAPQRGEVIRRYGLLLREHKESLGQLVSLEMGKSLQEGLGEVQEMIDICDFAVGLSRQLHGLTMHSERPGHRMYEQYHPLGLVGIISAFNFPVAVWSWNTALAWICGDVCIWKPSEKAPLCGVACQKLIASVLKENDLPEGISCLVNGDASVGRWMSEDHRIALVSATGSTRMGKDVAAKVAARLGKSLLELGGNNAVIITPDANLDIALRAAVFGAIGTCGQRCTSTRRLIVHKDRYETVKERLVKAYDQVRIGDPLDANNHMGPLIDTDAVDQYLNALSAAKEQGGKALIEGGKLEGKGFESECYVKPAIIEIDHSADIVQNETFAPILYLISYSGGVENAIEIQNEVRQGLSSSIISNNLQETETFLSHWGSDCGIANVNIGTSGAEIGGAFGGEKETGGGRESGSDAWKAYMRRQTNTLNFSKELPLAQGIVFDL